MASKQTQKRKYKKRTDKKKKRNLKKKSRKTRKKKIGGAINPLRSLFRHVNFASTRIADTWSGIQTPIHYDPDVTSQFGKNVLTNGKIANITGSKI